MTKLNCIVSDTEVCTFEGVAEKAQQKLIIQQRLLGKTHKYVCMFVCLLHVDTSLIFQNCKTKLVL
jgi:hypothetical protein